MGQRGTAADGEPQPAAQRGMNLAENNRTEVKPRVRVEPAIEIAQIVEGGVKKRTARLDFIDDAPMDRLPHRGHANQRGRANVGERARQRFRIDFERIDNRRAAGERQQHPAGELERVMQRKQRQHHVVGAENKDARQHRDFGGEVAMRQHHALGRAGAAGGEQDRRKRLSLGRRGRSFRVATQNEWTRELGEVELDEFRMRIAERSAEALVNRARAQRSRGLRDFADGREFLGGNQLIERHRNCAGG